MKNPIETQANLILRTRKARRIAREIESAPFDEEQGKAMFAGVPGVAKPSFDDRGEIVPVAGHDGEATADWSDETISGSSATGQELTAFILSAGPQTPEAIARRAAVAGSILGIITVERAARIAKC
ncbi:MAG TPA: hypothetical protein PLS03_15815, partial [Terrimicrobiaceae bacterium]|nr:hypothetical protein [Terrimicrobiaceae bacterium]